MSQRVKGQEVRVTFTGPTGTETGLSDIKSFEFELQLEILSEGYLGETTERKDDIFKGVKGRMVLHIEQQEYFRFTQRVKERSQRRTSANARFDATCSVALPNGQRPRVLLEDLFFGPLPMNVGGRDEYVEATIEFECSDLRYFFS